MIDSCLKPKTKALLSVIGLALFAIQTHATPVNLQIGDTVNVAEAPVNTWQPAPVVTVNINAPVLGYSGGVYAGVNTLEINSASQTTTGFCIDPFHFSSSSFVQYQVTDLASAPKSPPLTSGMGHAKASTIEKLWAVYYTSALTDPEIAAGLQIAIWETVADGVTWTDSHGNVVPAFSLQNPGNDHGASTLLAGSASYSGALPNLVALKSMTSGGQDYVVQGVPDAGSTATLLGAGFLLLFGFRGILKFQNR